MSKQYASVKFQNDWPKTVGGVALTSQLLTNRQTDGSRHAYIAAALALYRTCANAGATKNNVYPCKPQFYYIKVGFKGVNII